jgi:hypothetical protein
MNLVKKILCEAANANIGKMKGKDSKEN